MKRELIFGILFILLIGGFVLVRSEESNGEAIFDVGALLGVEGNITGSGLDYSIEETSQRKDTTFSFTGEESFLDIEGNRFENIVPVSENANAFIKLDEGGELIGADFMTNAKGGTYNFFGEDIMVPANSRVIFDKKNGLVINAAEGSEIKKGIGFKNLKLIGDNLKLSDGSILNSGELNYDSTGQAYIEKGKNVNLNGIQVSADKNLDVYFDGEKHSGNYVSFGEEFYFGGEGNPGEIVFDKPNQYFPKLEKGTSVKFSLGDEMSEMRIVPHDLKEFPDVYFDNQFSVETGQLFFNSDGDRLIQKGLPSDELFSVKMDLHSNAGEFSKLISIDSTSNYYSYVTEKGQNFGKSSLAYNRFQLKEGLQVKSNVYNSEYFREKVNPVSKYLQNVNNQILKEEFIKICPELAGKSFTTNNEIKDYSKNSKCKLSLSSVRGILENSGNGDYEKYRDYFYRAVGVIMRDEEVPITRAGSESFLTVEDVFGIYPGGNVDYESEFISKESVDLFFYRDAYSN